MKPEERAARISRMRDPGGTHEREAIKAELEVDLTNEVVQRLDQVSGDIQHAQKILANRLSDLAGEIKSTREAMNTSSEEMAALTKALVAWTRISVVAVIVYTVLMAIYVWLQFRAHP